MAFLLIKNSFHDASHPHCIHSLKRMKGYFRVIHETKYPHLPSVICSVKIKVNCKIEDSEEISQTCRENRSWPIFMPKQNRKKLGAREEMLFCHILRLAHVSRDECTRQFRQKAVRNFLLPSKMWLRMPDNKSCLMTPQRVKNKVQSDKNILLTDCDKKCDKLVQTIIEKQKIAI